MFRGWLKITTLIKLPLVWEPEQLCEGPENGAKTAATQGLLRLAGKACVPTHARLSGAPCTTALQAPLCVGVPRQEHCSGLPFPSPGDLPHPRVEQKIS